MYVKSQDSGFAVSNSSQLVLSSNNKRLAVAICNPSAVIIYLCKGLVATPGQGILLNALGGSYIDELDGQGNIYTDVYSAIALTVGGHALSIQEDYFEN